MSGDKRVYRTGSAIGYVAGVLMFVAPAVVIFDKEGYASAPEDHLLLMIVVGITFVPTAIYVLIQTWRQGVYVDDKQLCVRDGVISRRCVPLNRIQGVEWSYRYGPILLNRFDRGQAYVRIEWLSETDHTRSELIRYSGRSRHGAMAQMLRDLAASADLRPSRGSLDTADPETGEVLLERAAPVRSASRAGTEAEVFRAAPGARGAGFGCLITGAVLGIIPIASYVHSLRSDDTMPLGGAVLMFLVLAVVPAAIGLYYFAHHQNCEVELTPGALVVTDMLRNRREIPWDTVQALRWVHRHGKQQSGYLELVVLRRYPDVSREQIARYWGSLPGEIINLRGAIIRRLGLVQAEASEPGVLRPREIVVWARPGGWENGH